MLRCDSKTITSLTLHRRRPLYQRLDVLIFILLLFYTLKWCYDTSGRQLTETLHKQRDVQLSEFEGTFGEGMVYDFNAHENVFDNVVGEESPNNISAIGNEGDYSWFFKPESSWFYQVEATFNKEEELPYFWQPDFWASFTLCVIISLVILWQLLQYWSVSFKAFITCKTVKSLGEAHLVKVIPRKHRGKPSLVELTDLNSKRPSFVFQKVRFEYTCETNSFEKVKCNLNTPISSFISSTGINNDDEVKEKRRRFGLNRFEIPMPTFLEMYIEQITSPFFVFQVFCVALWCLEEYWQYSLFNLVMILGFEASVVQSRRMNIQKIRGMGNKATACEAFRNKKWILLSTEDLVPGDLIHIQGGKEDEATIPCDCLLLEGSAVVNESTLTGESIPLLKEAIAPSERNLDAKSEDKIHVLFGGTQLLEARNEAGKVTCYVLRTGFASSQGKLVRRIEFSTEKVTGDSLEAALLLGFLLCFALLSSGYVLHRGLSEGKRSRFDLLLHCILIITSVVPPDLPMQMALAVNTSLSALMYLSVFCTEPFRIPLAGSVSVCCFDKTGTLTSERLQVAGVVPSSLEAPKNFTTLIPAENAPKEFRLVVAACHSVFFSSGKLHGDPLEVAALLSISWGSDGRYALPLELFHNESKCMKGAPVEILHRHHFLSSLQRMSVIASYSEHRGNKRFYCFAKGSPERIYTLLKDSVKHKPIWYNEAYTALAKEGYRIIALAYRELASKELQHCCKDRDLAERNLTFAGFLTFNCRNRSDTKEVLQELIECKNNVCMITGDSLYTAAHVASEVGIARADKSLILFLKKTEAELAWVDFEFESLRVRYS
ncbi:probable manganese-transporting ATPase catp-8, partial [Zophobas morio]|uniref:probable manganese-transporting ATPase catp-8 n=1 Tax=Zophobas morio TaxID=2755281 RepID=UPI003082E7B8